MNTNPNFQNEWFLEMDYNEDDMIDIIDDIYLYEEANYIDLVSEKCYLGMSFYTKKKLILATRISTMAFFTYKFYFVYSYLYHYNIYNYYDDDEKYPPVDILKLIIDPDGSYSVIVKTFWLRLIQRRWKNILKKRKELLRKRLSLYSLRIREITGQFPFELRKEYGFRNQHLLLPLPAS